MAHWQKPFLVAALLCLAGCGGGGGSTTGSTGSGGSSSVSIPPPPPSTVGRIILNSVLARAIPNTIDTLGFRGLDAQGTRVFGPVFHARAATIVLENVPIAVRTLEIDYLQNGVLRGKASQPVQVSASQDTQIQDVHFTDVTYALTQIRLDPTSLQLRRGQIAPLRVQGSYADNTSSDVTEAAEWTSSNTNVAENFGGIVVARGIGSCTLTATVGSLSSQASVQVSRPLLQELQISPLNANLLEGDRLTYQVIGQFEDGSQEPIPDAIWSSHPDSVATISSEGESHALTPGECRIQASYDGLTSNATLTVAIRDTLTQLLLSPAQIQVPKGMALSYTAQASYTDGTSTDVTSSTTLESENTDVARVAEAFPSPALPPVVVPYNGLPGQFALHPPPFFPPDDNDVRAVGLGITRIFASFESLNAEAWLTVINPVPFEARVNPIQTHVLEVGGQVQLETLTALTDGTQETDRGDVSIEVQGNSTAVNGQHLLTAQQPGVDRLRALFPALPVLPGPARYSYYATSQFNARQRDYFTAPYEEAVVVVNQPLGLSFAAQAEQSGIGTVIENSPGGLIGVDYDHLISFGFNPSRLNPNTTDITALAAGNFTDGSTQQIFYAGHSWGITGADYAVAVKRGGLSPFPFPPITYTEFNDGAVKDAVVADFNEDGKSDAALVIDGQLLIRLTGATPLSELKSTTPLGFAGSQIGQGDFNGDQQVDLVVGGPGGLQIFLGDGAGNFAARPLLAAISVTGHLQVGDIDGDHHLDVTYMNSQGYGNRNWVVAFGDGLGGLGRVRSGTTGFRISASRLADMTGDGRADLVTVQSKSQRTLATDSDVSVSIHPGSSEGFGPQQVIQVSNTRSGADLVLRDVNADGRMDITLALTQPGQASGFGTVYNRNSSLVNLLRQP
ncbi:MAG: VCBS repeat-containing protein [Candidatus Eremiobacteraeota bacterium]|nr:VCBS repeat-containing protein [Candidatus Eremiobacteraeota bacterium]MCW5867948.1 VCBS repeat-containing protein [Candidatus Eremiobacteraeota bacterium]